MNEMPPKLNKKVLLQAVGVTVSQVLFISVVVTLIVKAPIFALCLLAFVLLTLHTLRNYRSMMFMNQNRN
jgi:uncharacterized Tic20 family protein